MAEFTLPENSRVRPGRTHPKPQGAKRVKEFKVYRWDPDSGDNPRLDVYTLDAEVEYIKPKKRTY